MAYAWNSVRIGFFDWLDKKHDHLLSDGEAEAAAGGSSGAKVAPDAAAAEAGGAEAQQPKKGRKKIHPCFRMLWCVCAPALSPPRRGARGGCARAPHRGPTLTAAPAHPAHTHARVRAPHPCAHSHKCGEDSLHWYADSTAGAFLSIVFAVACAALLASRPECEGGAC